MDRVVHSSAKPSVTRRARKTSPPPAAKAPEAAARDAGLKYVSDTEPGIHRQHHGSGFRYCNAAGKPVRHRRTLERIENLVIPPAWSDVWICADADGHLQAVGRDARGRKQYLYHPEWRDVRDATKYEQMLAFAAVLPKIRRRVRRDLKLPGLPREKVLAAVIALMERTLIRVGNEEYSKTNHSYGLTTLRDRHVRVRKTEIHFHFRGKSGVEHEIDLDDPVLAGIVRKCQDLPGQNLFQYTDEAGEIRKISSGDVNAYLREVTEGDFTCKDFRTWSGTLLAALFLRELEQFTSATAAKKNIAEAVRNVAQRLGNTASICRKCYIHPGVIDSYLDQSLPENFELSVKRVQGKTTIQLSSDEKSILKLLRKRHHVASRS